MIVKMIQNFKNRMEKMQELFTKDLKNKQRWMVTLERINRITEEEE